MDFIISATLLLLARPALRCDVSLSAMLFIAGFLLPFAILHQGTFGSFAGFLIHMFTAAVVVATALKAISIRRKAAAAEQELYIVRHRYPAQWAA